MKPSRRKFLAQMAGIAAWASGLPATSFGRIRAPRLPNPESPQFWKLVRHQFALTPDRIYFNSGGLGPTPYPVLAAVQAERQRLERICETGHAIREEVAERVAGFLGAHADEICFTRNATEGMNMIARGVPLQAGDEVVMTTHEHPGGALPWLALAKEKGLRVRLFEPENEPERFWQNLQNVLSPRTRVIMVSHITCTLGAVLPVRKICDMARSRNILTVLDGAQAVGQIPVDLHEIGCNFYTTSGHKWLLGPKESGILFISRKIQSKFRPTFVGAYSDREYDLDRLFVVFRREAMANEYGTRDAAKVRGIDAAVKFFEDLGPERAYGRIAALAARLRDRLHTIEGVNILTPAGAGRSAGIVTFRLRGQDYRVVSRRLMRDYHIRVRNVGEHGLGAIRVSLHVFNQEQEIEMLVEALKSMAKGA